MVAERGIITSNTGINTPICVKVKKFTLLPELFSIDKGEMTPKMSIVRKKVIENYSELINKMYE